ncbi:MAG: indole-3-glycerol phosphate synthase TrpC [Chitinophagaceae bacterium]|nr:indole-3-glycerol phosphate synthase TrpC [Chitinophagaceae bacterium]
MNILDKIIEHKHLEVIENRIKFPIQELQNTPGFTRKVLSFREALLNEKGTGIIAEFKRQSPSKGVINGNADVVKVTGAYTANGAAALSVLTDQQFFGGSNEDLKKARVNNIPILRKDFIVDEYQIVEAKAIGADVILLIAACLTPEEVKRLASFAKEIGLEVLLEIHNEDELKHICEECDVVGVNNRDLKTFTVDINRSIKLSAQIPAGKVKIAESGITDTDTIFKLREGGFRGFLIGENFMKQPDPAIAFASFVKHLKTG